MYRSLDLMANHAAKVAVPDLTQEVRSMATTAGWPIEASSALEVIEADGDLTVKILDHATDLVNKLEYGTDEVSPNPVIRKFTSQLDDRIQDHLHEALKLHGRNFLEEL